MLMYRNVRTLRDLSKVIPHFEWQQQGRFHYGWSQGLDDKEMINQKLQAGRLAVNRSLKRSRKPDESQSLWPTSSSVRRIITFTCYTMRIHL